MPTVSVIVPCRNEVRHIRAFLQSLLAQELRPDLDCEFLIADGVSLDGTRTVLTDWQSRLKGLVILNNEKKTVPAGLNAAIALSRGEIIIRMDVHAEYAPDYIRQCVVALDETGADNVGGPALTRGVTYIERAVCAAYHSAFGCGGARFHNPGYEGYVDTVTYGCWRKRTLEKLGLFDEELVRNQDDELNLRLIRKGGKIWQTPKIRSWYYPRSSLRALVRQHTQYGYWKVRVIQKHRVLASWRHLVPGAFAATLFALGASALFLTLSANALVAVLTVYGFAGIVAGLIACGRKNLSLVPVMPFIFASYHVPYGIGFLGGLCDMLMRRKPAQIFTALTR